MLFPPISYFAALLNSTDSVFARSLGPVERLVGQDQQILGVFEVVIFHGERAHADSYLELIAIGGFSVLFFKREILFLVDRYLLMF